MQLTGRPPSYSAAGLPIGQLIACKLSHPALLCLDLGGLRWHEGKTPSIFGGAVVYPKLGARPSFDFPFQGLAPESVPQLLDSIVAPELPRETENAR